MHLSALSPYQCPTPVFGTYSKPTVPPAVRQAIDKGHLKHVAITMDGDRRWATRRGLEPIQGHHQGYNTLKSIVAYCATDLKLPTLTVYVFSTETWNRPQDQVSGFMRLFEQAIADLESHLQAHNTRLRVIGDMRDFPETIRKKWEAAVKSTRNNTGTTLQLAMGYGGRDELVRVTQQIARLAAAGRLKPDNITELTIAKRLDTAQMGDPDLVIRPGGEHRISNFLPWQSTYAELYFCNTLWPNFSPHHLNRALIEFTQRKRRFGK